MNAPTFPAFGFLVTMAAAPSVVAKDPSVKPLWGTSDFKSLVADGAFSQRVGLVSAVDESRSKFVLISCPPQSGKTVMLSLLKAYYSPESDAQIAWFGSGVPDINFKKHPVVEMSFKNLNRGSFDAFQKDFSVEVSRLLQSFSGFFRPSLPISYPDRQAFKNLDASQSYSSRTPEQLGKEFALLTRLWQASLRGLNSSGGEVVVLFDNYSFPVSGVSSETDRSKIIDFLKRFFEVALNDNTAISRVVFAGSDDGLEMLEPLGIVSTISLSSPHKAFCGLTRQQAHEMGATEQQLRDLLPLSSHPLLYRFKDTIEVLNNAHY